MRFFALVLFITAAGFVVSAQTPAGELPDAPSVKILKARWSQYYNRFTRNNSGSDDAGAAERRARRRRNPGSMASRPGSMRDDPYGSMDSSVGGDPFLIGPRSQDRARSGYSYEVKIENTGAKEIKAIEWDYVFIEPGTERISSHHRFQTAIKIATGKEKKLTGLSLTPPTMVIRADALDRPLIEQVIINRIEYADGTFWQRT
ncbi:MAG TPA: hypothetical protein VGC64_05045 [Pyrinomonadaceae bacterium]|jgi:hypothetical protein